MPIKWCIIIGIGTVVIVFMFVFGLIAKNLRKREVKLKLKNIEQQRNLEELERANKNYIRIMRVMAHDLRNPLSGMTSLAAMLLGEGEFSDDSKHMLHLIESTGLHTMEMINELLKTGLADESEPISTNLTDLSALLYDSVELLQFKAREKFQQIEFKSSGSPIHAWVNHEKMWRVFNNLIVNAIKFSYQGGMIYVSITSDKHFALISIEDNGIGIPKDNAVIIFEMFTSAKKTGTNGEQPFGLGLSISKKIVEKHGGKIWFESIPGMNTKFYIKLPLQEKK